MGSSPIDPQVGTQGSEHTTPGAGYAVGEVFYVLGSGASYGIAPSDWVLRLVAGYPSNGGKP